MITEERKVVILAFNAGTSGLLVNGPGVSLRNLVIFMGKFYPNVSFSLFTKFRANISSPNISCFSSKDKRSITRSIRDCDVVHLWSGLTASFLELGQMANKRNKPVLLGPNLFDTVDLRAEAQFLRGIAFERLFSSNPNVGKSIASKHNIDPSRVTDFMVGPDRDMWGPPSNYSDYILWKGNSKQPVKGYALAKEVATRLPEYKFLFMGNGNRYSYEGHIGKASRAMLFLNTSISETKGMAQLEQMAAGVPSVVSKGVYAKGINGETGYFADRTVNSYVGLIKRVLSDCDKLNSMRLASTEYVDSQFSAYNICKKYMELIDNVC